MSALVLEYLLVAKRSPSQRWFTYRYLWMRTYGCADNQKLKT